MFKEGKGHTVDKPAAFGYFLKSAEQGNSFAQYNLGIHLLPSFTSFYLFTPFFLLIFLLIGEMLRKGEGCTADKAKALELFQKSVDQGNKYAMFSLGMHMREEDGRGQKRWGGTVGVI